MRAPPAGHNSKNTQCKNMALIINTNVGVLLTLLPFQSLKIKNDRFQQRFCILLLC